jgi:pimeloyl-ACP methyl ester carboxylesterase
MSKYQKHVGSEFDAASEKLRNKYDPSKTIERYDRVVEVQGVAYWQHSVGIEPSRIEGPLAIKSVRTKIGMIDRHGWVYLPSGQRVLYTALVKWADELIMGSSQEISRLIDGLISPFAIQTESRQYGIFIGGTGMHMFGLGNVERLYNMYDGTKFYYGGVGNPAEYESKNRGFADNGAGYGWTEILDRIEADVLSHYRGWQKLHVFGWSRGAAMGIEFARRMGRFGIEVEFLGLFDPVYSYFLPGQSSSLIQWSPQGRQGNYVSAIPTTNVKAIGALYAIHEDRSFFPATRLTQDGITRMKLMKSPGAHGEIGGHFLSDLSLQRMNLRAMVEFAMLDGNVRFAFRGIEQDLVQIFSSPVTKKLQTQAIVGPVTRIEGRGKAFAASEISSWQAMRADEYYRELIECSVQRWKPSGYGFQRGRWTGAIAYGLEWGHEVFPPSILSSRQSLGPIRQTPYSHYLRDLDWCELELWDLEFMKDSSGRNRLTERQKEQVRFFYQLKVDPRTGGWLFNGRPVDSFEAIPSRDAISSRGPRGGH